MSILDRVMDRWRGTGYWEGVASGAAVLFQGGTPDNRRESTVQTLVGQATDAYQTNGVVFAVILARLMLLSEARFKLRSKVDKRMYGTEDLRILEYPWPGGTTGELWARMEQDVSLAGNCFIWKAQDDLLVRLPPTEVTIVSKIAQAPTGTYRRVIGYDWDPAKNTPGQKPSPQAQFFTVDEVAHWSPYPDPQANFRGMSWLTPVLRDVGADTGLVTYKTKYLERGHPITAIKYPMKLKPETVDSLTARIVAKYGGVSNAHTPLILDQGSDPVLGGGLRDIEYAATSAAGAQRICSAGGVDPLIIGLASASAAEMYGPAIRRFGDGTARPLWRSGCAALQKLVPNIPERGVELWYDTSDIAALQAAETERAQVNQVNAAALLTLVQAGYTRPSSIAYLASGDITQLEPDPNAPTPGVTERETVGIKGGTVPVTGPDSANGTLSKPPGGGQTLTKPQTPASKQPMPASIPTAPSVNGQHRPTVNGRA